MTGSISVRGGRISASSYKDFGKALFCDRLYG